MDSPTSRARRLRQTLTDAERKLWYAVRGRRLLGYKFRRQVWLGSYVADFVCAERRLIVELDGGQHAEAGAYDGRRTVELMKLGYRVIRYWNTDVLHNLDGVLSDLVKELERERAPSP
jgi:very-short-patch-repair endonuclease